MLNTVRGSLIFSKLFNKKSKQCLMLTYSQNGLDFSTNYAHHFLNMLRELESVTERVVLRPGLTLTCFRHWRLSRPKLTQGERLDRNKHRLPGFMQC